MQPVLLDVLQKRAAGAVHDRLGLTGRAGRVEDVDRVVEGQLRERERRRVGLQVIGTEDGVRDRPGVGGRSRNGTSTVRRRPGMPGATAATLSRMSIRLPA